LSSKAPKLRVKDSSNIISKKATARRLFKQRLLEIEAKIAIPSLSQVEIGVSRVFIFGVHSKKHIGGNLDPHWVWRRSTARRENLIIS